jgi:3-oxoacyl-[acyl-carrier protein] reductase
MNILITGGSTGLGAAIVTKLAAEGSHKIRFTFASSREKAEALAAAFPNTEAVHCDFTDAESVTALCDRIAGMDLDVLINNANGKVHKEHFYKTDPEVFLKSFEHNVMPAIRITQQALVGFRKKRSGRIINVISSYVVNKPPTGLSIYVANKNYLLSMSNSWASEYGKFNISSNCVSPSFMLTGLTADTDERVIAQMEQEHPLHHLLTVEEAADTVAFLITATPHINGTNLIINAGSDIK